MKNFYYIYNNEALACCVYIAVLKHCQIMDVARLCLILPLVFDERTVNYMIGNQNISYTLQQLMADKEHSFLTINTRFNMLLPVCINSLQILSKYNLIEMDGNIRSKNDISFDNVDLGKRFNKINRIIPKIIQLMNSYRTDELYRMFKIQL